MSKLLCLFSAVMCFAVPICAQVPITNGCPADAPVTIVVGEIKPGAEIANAVITNKGGQPISAVLLRWKFTDSNGTTIPMVSSVDMAVAGELLAPGQNVTMEATMAPGQGFTVEKVDVTCAAVLFNGKGFWGEKGLPEVTRLLGIRTGIRSERSRLLRLYQAQGSEKLIAELKRPVIN